MSLASNFRKLQLDTFQSICFDDSTNLRLAARIVKTSIDFYKLSKEYLLKEHLLTEEEKEHWKSIKIISLELLQDALTYVPSILRDIENAVDENGDPIGTPNGTAHAQVTITRMSSDIASVFQSEEIELKEKLKETDTNTEYDLDELIELANY